MSENLDFSLPKEVARRLWERAKDDADLAALYDSKIRLVAFLGEAAGLECPPIDEAMLDRLAHKFKGYDDIQTLLWGFRVLRTQVAALASRQPGAEAEPPAVEQSADTSSATPPNTRSSGFSFDQQTGELLIGRLPVEQPSGATVVGTMDATWPDPIRFSGVELNGQYLRVGHFECLSQMRQAHEELSLAHAALDGLDVPRRPHGLKAAPWTLPERIAALSQRATQAAVCAEQELALWKASVAGLLDQRAVVEMAMACYRIYLLTSEQQSVWPDYPSLRTIRQEAESVVCIGLAYHGLPRAFTDPLLNDVAETYAALERMARRELNDREPAAQDDQTAVTAMMTRLLEDFTQVHQYLDMVAEERLGVTLSIEQRRQLHLTPLRERLEQFVAVAWQVIGESLAWQRRYMPMETGKAWYDTIERCWLICHQTTSVEQRLGAIQRLLDEVREVQVRDGWILWQRAEAPAG